MERTLYERMLALEGEVTRLRDALATYDKADAMAQQALDDRLKAMDEKLEQAASRASYLMAHADV